MHKTLSRSRQFHTRFAAAVFLTPAFVFLLVYIVYSTIDAFHLSLFKWNGIDPQMTFVGLKNWQDLISDAIFFKSFQHNVIIIVLSIIIQLPIAMALAVLLDYGGKRLNILKVSYYIPSLLSSVAVGILFRYVFDPNNGIMTAISGLFGAESMDLLGSSQYALYTVFSVICWTAIPFYMVYFLAGLAGLSSEIYEASIIDGATRTKYFFRIALPILKPIVKNAAVLSMIGSLKYFDLIYVMTEGGPNNASDLMATYMYRTAFRYMSLGYGATIATAMFIIITAISLAVLLIINRRMDD
jgi:raffinose/stachyose/melibiose transport system permease protein